jgi:poly(A) polymerase/tRNA nucleotidyltransferase (CCA-adding enzyme)
VTEPALRIDPAWLAEFAGLPAVLAALRQPRLVGGCVRDRIAGLKLSDIDLATPDPPEEVMRRLEGAGLRAIPTGLAHGTVTALSGGAGFEITTLRRDVETDGRHAVVAFTDDWREDAARRDFTINALSMTPGGAVFDYFDGLADLEARRVRFVGEAASRIAEDHLRILRYFRFFARYGAGGADPQAIAAIFDGKAGLAALSAERVWSEVRRILITPMPDAALALAADTGVLAAILPEAILRAVDALPPDPLLRLAALLPAPGRVAERLRMSGGETWTLAALFGPVPDEQASDHDLRRALADTPGRILIGRSWLAQRSPALRARIEAFQPPVFPLQGRDLIAAGWPPGPAMGTALAGLRAVWLASGCQAPREALLAQLAPPAAG